MAASDDSMVDMAATTGTTATGTTTTGTTTGTNGSTKPNGEGSALAGNQIIVRLESLNHTFSTKMLTLIPSHTHKIGRKVGPHVLSEPTNGIFDAKVLSRIHAELLLDSGRPCIRDMKSSNGTFVNGSRLSDEGVASGAFELCDGDRLDFGIDIVGDDGTTVMYKKVACKVSIIDGAEASSWLLSAAASSGANSNKTLSSQSTHQQQMKIKMQQEFQEQEQHAKFVDAKAVSEAHSILDDEIRIAAEAATMLKYIRKSFDLMENQAMALPAIDTLDTSKTLGISQLLVAASVSMPSNPIDSAAPFSAPMPIQNTEAGLMRSVDPTTAPTSTFPVPDYSKELDEITSQQKSMYDKIVSLQTDMSTHMTRIAEFQAMMDHSATESTKATALFSEFIHGIVSHGTDSTTEPATAVEAADVLSQCIHDTRTAKVTLDDMKSKLDAMESRTQMPVSPTPLELLQRVDEVSLECARVASAAALKTEKDLTDLRGKLTTEAKTVSQAHAKRLDSLDKAVGNVKEHTGLQQAESERITSFTDVIRSDLNKMIASRVDSDAKVNGIALGVESLTALVISLQSDIERLKCVSSDANQTHANVGRVDSATEPVAIGASEPVLRRRKHKSTNELKQLPASKAVAVGSGEIVADLSGTSASALCQQPDTTAEFISGGIKNIALMGFYSGLGALFFAIALYLFSDTQ
ncbi:hypothetical protein BASA50_011073 [Batrachochytrium salamandrivorans]|uniref:FHA domain-containing protein n=1 Tax=Batrachochytrium salamandrivorans TaxID=1357716 RepID=A0ABQ8EWV7_9FUNG|nr:hypothetical protein BASA62_010394 [Batrachochytrium salamandrivorans]KAH6581869.1 hypothetical protein BASA61_008877 [Batrachochytrium salamandrivorans]KAH6587881.1 hypothetical protein BASA50_011073 [Batrachochytrium salamandrivorans]